MEPITFTPHYMTRVWGGRSLETIYGRALPDEQPYGESWEISDRPEAQSVVDQGPFFGKTLHELWTENRAEIFGSGMRGESFPLLIKILDARDELSIQVHPPENISDELGGEPKTEMWYIAHADPDAKLYVGLKNGVTREEFADSVESGDLADKVHAIEPKSGESIFIPSGRLHAIGAGLVIFEIQQNSDTTYRVFDWNRDGLDGKPRELHIEKSLRSIDFDDFEPVMDQPVNGVLATSPYFVVEKIEVSGEVELTQNSFAILAVVAGEISIKTGRKFRIGDFVLCPCDCDRIEAVDGTILLKTSIPI